MESVSFWPPRTGSEKKKKNKFLRNSLINRQNYQNFLFRGRSRIRIDPHQTDTEDPHHWSVVTGQWYGSISNAENPIKKKLSRVKKDKNKKYLPSTFSEIFYSLYMFVPVLAYSRGLLNWSNKFTEAANIKTLGYVLENIWPD